MNRKPARPVLAFIGTYAGWMLHGCEEDTDLLPKYCATICYPASRETSISD